VDSPLRIDDHIGASSFHVPFPSSLPLFSPNYYDLSNHAPLPSSLPLFSPCNYPSNQDEDFVISLRESCIPLEKGLPIA